jgi:hypothetical protein
LFYVRAYKEAEDLFRKTLKICQHSDTASLPQPLLASYLSELHSLLFEVSVMRLNDIMKFESYEAVEEYILKFTSEAEQLGSLIPKHSLNYYKSKYQFYILCYLHDKKSGI